MIICLVPMLVSLCCSKQIKVTCNGNPAPSSGTITVFRTGVVCSTSHRDFSQVLAASKNKIKTLKNFPYLPVLEVSYFISLYI